VGFTDMAANVIKTYFEEFIPNVLTLTELFVREGKEDRYQWTTGSWLVYRYLEEASPENRRRMERAIARGDFVWHGLPFTTHTELMDRSLLSLETFYSRQLDQRFGRKTLSAKMTDVPGHTRGMVPVMAEAGIELFHVGVNTGSAMPDIPPLFIWKTTDGKELTVMYQHDYGGVALLPGGKTAVSINFTSDNHGPHSPEQIVKIYADLRKQFPKSKVFASNLNAVAKEARLLRDRLPVVTQEIGDTWIHGPGSDPLLMGRFRELSRLRREWVGKGILEANGETDRAFGKHLLLIPEHTWGLHIGSAGNWDVYDMSKFRSSRGLPEFRMIEASWAEKRANIDRAVAVLPAALKTEAESRIKSLKPERTIMGKLLQVDPANGLFDTKYFKIGLDPKTGAVNFLENKQTQRNWASASQPLGLFSYETFSSPDFERFMKQYVPQNLLLEGWVVQSWNKPGLEKSSAKSALYFTTLKQLWHEKRKDGDFFLAQLEIPEAGDSGCPKEIYVETFLPNNEPILIMTLKWFDKPASRLPEACWLSFIPSVLPNGQFLLDKMGQPVSPMDVVKGGNRNLHGVTEGISYKDNHSGFQLETLDAFLVAPGRRALLNFDNQQPDMDEGLHFCLLNNLTGTNFTMWFEEDIQFRFILKFIH
ncbi:MAG: DUF5054 domain-containing protein, partial [Bacteroidales bacterium]|nr:DUF5054 domain-containing protein [Bacteroidales bacterium]